jgi:hypothetical protein
VAIESENGDEMHQVAVAELETQENFLAPVDPQSLQFPRLSFDAEKAISQLFEEEKTIRVQELDTFTTGIQEMRDEIKYLEHVYPLKLRLSKPLAKLKLIEDGSHLFKPKEINQKTAALSFSTTCYPIAYTIKVSGESGKVVSWKRKKELIDKKMQSCADKLIETLVFGPSKEKEIKGKIWITFACPEDELVRYLK